MSVYPLHVPAIYVAAHLLSDHQTASEGRCSCGDALRPELNSADAIAAHQALILTEAGLIEG